MRDRLAPSLMFLIALASQQFAEASPIAYNFVGNFDPSGSVAVDGTVLVTGSFTINAQPTSSPTLVPGGGTAVIQNGSNVSLTVNALGQTFHFDNTLQNPNIATFTAFEWPSGSPPNATSSPMNEMLVMGSRQIGNTLTTFSMSFYKPGGPSVLTNPGSFVYNMKASTFNFSVSTNSVVDAGGGGILKTVEAAAVPEPSTLAVFAVLGIAGLIYRRLRDQSADREGNEIGLTSPKTTLESLSLS